MKETDILPEATVEPQAVEKNNMPRRAFRGGARAIVKQFKEWQRLPFLAMSANANDVSTNVPSEGMELSSFYHL
jgi:hypothetical protein